MKISKFFGILFCAVLVFTLNAQAQSLPETGNLGIRANIGGQFTIEMPYMLNENLSLAPYLGINIRGDINDNVEDGSKRFVIGVMPRFYLNEVASSIATYATGNLGLDITSPNASGADSRVDFILGAGYGAEYFFSDSFSVSADANLNLSTGDSRTLFGTMARVSASIYFN